MSLQGIFDPMVRAYFEKKYGGGSGGAPDTGVLAFKYIEGNHESAIFGDEIPMVKIFEPVDLLKTGGTVVDVVNWDPFASLTIESMDMGIECSILSGEDFVGLVVTEEYLEETGLPSAGLWMASDFFGGKSNCILLFAKRISLE